MSFQKQITQTLKYDSRDILGKGGFATVYKGRDDALKQDVAIKILRRYL